MTVQALTAFPGYQSENRGRSSASVMRKLLVGSSAELVKIVGSSPRQAKDSHRRLPKQ
ncbi:MAG: hypothetical protein RL459_1998 [Pseudomonadota bacterium]|jgi:hypothetical protein